MDPSSRGSVVDALDAIVVAYVHRRVDAPRAVELLCEVVAQSPARCALVVRGKTGYEVLAGKVDEHEAAAMCLAAARAGDGRHLSARETDAEAFRLLRDDQHDFIAVEPMTSRSSALLGSLVVMGARGVREDVLHALPAAGLLASDIAFELMVRTQVDVRLHKFNNVLFVLSTNAELLASSAADEDQVREIVAQASKLLVASASDLCDALPIGRWSKRAKR